MVRCLLCVVFWCVVCSVSLFVFVCGAVFSVVVVRSLLFVVGLFVVGRSLCVVSCWMFVVCCLLFIVQYLRCIVCCVLFVRRGPLFVVRR